MIFTATGRSPLDFNGYGCYCGFGGKGAPLDGVDRYVKEISSTVSYNKPGHILLLILIILCRCCQMHDTCYSDLKKKGHCKSLEVYLLSYRTTLPLTCGKSVNLYFSIHNNNCIDGNKFCFLFFHLAKNNSKCRDGLCECDVSAALCFKTQTFQEKYRKYDRSKCKNEVKV